jgi:hypothetical protein
MQPTPAILEPNLSPPASRVLLHTGTQVSRMCRQVEPQVFLKFARISRVLQLEFTPTPMKRSGTPRNLPVALIGSRLPNYVLGIPRMSTVGFYP